MAGRLTKRRVLVALLLVACMAYAGWRIWRLIAWPPADFSKLTPTFAASPTQVRDLVRKAVTAGEAQDYAASVDALEPVAKPEALSEDQKQALIYALTEIRRKLTERTPPDANLLLRIDELILKLTG